MVLRHIPTKAPFKPNDDKLPEGKMQEIGESLMYIPDNINRRLEGFPNKVPSIEHIFSNKVFIVKNIINGIMMLVRYSDGSRKVVQYIRSYNIIPLSDLLIYGIHGSTNYAIINTKGDVIKNNISDYTIIPGSLFMLIDHYIYKIPSVKLYGEARIDCGSMDIKIESLNNNLQLYTFDHEKVVLDDDGHSFNIDDYRKLDGRFIFKRHNDLLFCTDDATRKKIGIGSETKLADIRLMGSKFLQLDNTVILLKDGQYEHFESIEDAGDSWKVGYTKGRPFKGRSLRLFNPNSGEMFTLPSSLSSDCHIKFVSKTDDEFKIKVNQEEKAYQIILEFLLEINQNADLENKAEKKLITKEVIVEETPITYYEEKDEKGSVVSKFVMSHSQSIAFDFSDYEKVSDTVYLFYSVEGSIYVPDLTSTPIQWKEIKNSESFSKAFIVSKEGDQFALRPKENPTYVCSFFESYKEIEDTEWVILNDRSGGKKIVGKDSGRRCPLSYLEDIKFIKDDDGVLEFECTDYDSIPGKSKVVVDMNTGEITTKKIKDES